MVLGKDEVQETLEVDGQQLKYIQVGRSTAVDAWRREAARLG